MEIERFTIPGRGVLSVCLTRSGHRIGVLRTDDDEVELDLFVGATDEPGAVIPLEPDESDSLANLIFSPPLLDRLATIERKLTDLLGQGRR
jgi:TrkA domain protein